MAMIAMSAILLSAPKLLGTHWELFRWIIPVFVVLMIVCKIVRADDRVSEMSFVQPLLALLFFWISYSMENRQIEEPMEFRKKQSKKIKDGSTKEKRKSPCKCNVLSLKKDPYPSKSGEFPKKDVIASPNPPPPPPKRKNRKGKKKKTKMEREREKLKYAVPPKPTGYREPLDEYTSMGLDVLEIYNWVSRLTLTRTQLRQQDYPLDSPDHPGHVYPESSLPGYVTERRCARCQAQFFIEGNVYKSNTQCVHHLPVKRSTVTGLYECCNGNQWSEGCKVSPYHVTAQHSFDGVPFHRIRKKRQVRGGEFCNVFGMDCEMSYTTAGLEVVKVGLVGLDGLAVYETYVKPDNAVLDYNTRYSGVTADDLKGVTTTLADVQAYLLKTLNTNTILVGHALSNDLKALRIIHERVVDTSVIYPHRDNMRWKYSLRTLAREHLSKVIQDGMHDCIEDARTSMALVLLKVGNECTKNSYDVDENCWVPDVDENIWVPDVDENCWVPDVDENSCMHEINNNGLKGWCQKSLVMRPWWMNEREYEKLKYFFINSPKYYISVPDLTKKDFIGEDEPTYEFHVEFALEKGSKKQVQRRQFLLKNTLFMMYADIYPLGRTMEVSMQEMRDFAEWKGIPKAQTLLMDSLLDEILFSK